MVVCPSVKVKAVEPHAGLAEGDLDEEGADVPLEYRVSEAEVGGSLRRAQETWSHWPRSVSWSALRACAKASLHSSARIACAQSFATSH